MASPLVFISWEICNYCFEFTLRYRFPIYMDTKTKTITVNKSFSKVITLSLFAALIQVFILLLMLFVLEPIHLPNIEIGVELKIVYLFAVILSNNGLFLGVGLYCYSEIFAFFHNALARFDIDLRRLYLPNFRQSEERTTYTQLVFGGN